MTATPTTAVMKATLQAYVDRINAGDAAGVTALFAPGAVIEDPIGSAPRSGDDIAQWFADTVAFATRITPVVPHRGSHGDEALVVFDVEFTPPGGERLRIRSADACRFDAEGRIVSLRAYWGPDDLGPA
ncbi:nuclear transport factor 2 (plasmid) [Novosphingobium aromaticivorans DSM 12444]|uniref:Nuclear transport factor 2 n=1 Tax=Novosphingobium aromaticivorans (strain ATCC 700278 / DSM 12444 / CCUG 56034 / CIP 105152 / NBRC 16084 / F199) TaxID=279238 RepID=A4XEU5_NOVAD|nr:steroid Delta-isomerase [Novosphingobium aromaticivorans]ABP64456.1 nuclear transport factor 2 [Novosphingobium aromaticivorans DSM 12444]SCY91254.1 steroid delta-isomerase [Novosphingobium aromaticivorans]